MRRVLEELENEMAYVDSLLFRLHNFLDREDCCELVGDMQYGLMNMQLDAMRIYSGVLYLRIEDLKKNENQA